MMVMIVIMMVVAMAAVMVMTMVFDRVIMRQPMFMGVGVALGRIKPAHSGAEIIA